MKLSAKGLVAGVIALSASFLAVPVTAAQALPLLGGSFRADCSFSHRLPDDPIVSPNQPGASHLHDFFGNTTTDAFSTYESLREGGTTCTRALETAAYWVPVASQNGEAVEPSGMTVYYQASNKDPAKIRAHPANLRVIAGDAKATGPQDPSVTSWQCAGTGALTGSPVPTCLPGSALTMNLLFPDCWDGVNLDSANHKSHMAYAQTGGGLLSRRACPASHPVAVPQIRLSVRYPTPGGPGLSLSSGSAFTAHGDFINSWYQPALEALVEKCIKGLGVLACPAR